MVMTFTTPRRGQDIVRILKFRSLRLPISPNLLVPIFPYSSLSFANSRDSSRFLAAKTMNLTNLQDPPSLTISSY